MVPRRCGTLRLLGRRDRRVERADHLVGDVVLRVDVDGFLQDDVVLFLFGDLLDDAVWGLLWYDNWSRVIRSELFGLEKLWDSLERFDKMKFA